MSYRLCSKFHTLSSSVKMLKISYDLTNYKDSKGGNFFETQCRRTMLPIRLNNSWKNPTKICFALSRTPSTAFTPCYHSANTVTDLSDQGAIS